MLTRGAHTAQRAPTHFFFCRPTPLIRWKCNPSLINTSEKATQLERNDDVAATCTQIGAQQLQTAPALFCEYVVVI